MRRKVRRKHQHAAKPGEPRTKVRHVRFTVEEDRRMVARSKRGGFPTASAYLRQTSLEGQQVDLPPWQLLREVRDAVIHATEEIVRSPPGPARDRALEASIRAMDRISQF